MPRKMMVALLVVATGFAGALAVAGEAGAVSKKKSKLTYGFTTVDWQVGDGSTKLVRKPKRFVSGFLGIRVFDGKGLSGYGKRWGSKSVTVKAKKTSACDAATGGNCSETRGGKVTFKALKKFKCQKPNGKSKAIWVYTKAIGKMPKHKGYRKGRKSSSIARLFTDSQNNLLNPSDSTPASCPK